MADTIESFVGRLQKDGVEAGKAEAAKLVADAKAEGERIVADARKQAEGIVADAQAEAARTLEQGRGELELAARDVFGRVRKQIGDAVGEALRLAAARALGDEAFLADLLHDVIVEYARKDAEGVWPIEVRISDEVAEKVIDVAVKALAAEGKGEGALSLSGRLKSAGFEYTVSGGTVEVTDESVAGALGEMIAPKLRELVDRAAGTEK